MKKKSSVSSQREKRTAASKIFTSPLTKAQRKELASLAGLAEREIDYSDAPSARAKERVLVGEFYRPVKKLISLRVDADVLAWYRAQGAGYQTKMNDALRKDTRLGR